MIKHILTAAIATLAFGPAAADVVATLPNNAGGHIRLTDDACSSRVNQGMSLRFAYSTTKDGRYFTGCWGMVDDDVMVFFDDGERRLYPADNFTIRKKKADRPARNSL